MHIENHPFPEFIPTGATALIVGSFPPIRLTVKNSEIVSGNNKNLYENYFSSATTNKDIAFYYGSRNNLFWKIIEDVFDIKLLTKEDIEDFLSEKMIGVTDLIEKCSRKSKKNGNLRVSIGSLDSDLIVVEKRSVIETIKKNNFDKIYCTSNFVKKMLVDMDQEYFLSNNINIVTLFSPSPSASRSIGRRADYKKSKKDGIVKNTIEFRVKKYKEAFGFML